MANCKYCGQPAGMFRHEHEECHKRHDVAAQGIRDKFVSALKNNLDPVTLRANVEHEASQNFIGVDERREVVRQGMLDLVAAATQKPIDDTDYTRVTAIQHAFALTNDDLGYVWNVLYGSRILTLLDEGKIDKIQTTFSGPFAPRLEKNEHGIWAFSGVKYLVMKRHTQYVGRSSGVSVRLMKGVYYHTGSYSGTPIQTEYLSEQDVGGLSITNRNVYYVGSNVAEKLPLNKIISVQLHIDGIEILENGRNKKPLILQFGDPGLAASLLARLHDS